MASVSPFAFAFVAFAHLVGVVLAVPTVLARGLLLRRAHVDTRAKDLALHIDGWWGLSALVVLPTGLYRVFTLGKGVSFYVNNPFFIAKMAIFAVVFALELWPMIVLIQERIVMRRGASILTERRARAFAAISLGQAALLVVALFCATMMARGVGQR